MIHFNELYITEDGKNLVIDAEIDDFPAYKDCYLERITVDTTKHCEEPGLFKEPLVVWEVVEELITGQEQHVRLCLDASLLVPLINMKDSLSDHIFVVKVEAVMVDKTGDIAKMGCGWDNYIIYGAAYDGYPMYRNFLDLGESYSDDCDDSDTDALSDFILTYYGFDFALRMGDWCTAWKYWNEMKGSTTGAGVMLGRGCGCHGAY